MVRPPAGRPPPPPPQAGPRPKPPPPPRKNPPPPPPRSSPPPPPKPLNTETFNGTSGPCNKRVLVSDEKQQQQEKRARNANLSIRAPVILRDVNVFKKENQVGQGTYGSVFVGVDKLTSEVVALKRINTEQEENGFPITAIREVKILKALNHENVVELKEIVTSKGAYFSKDFETLSSMFDAARSFDRRTYQFRAPLHVPRDGMQFYPPKEKAGFITGCFLC